MYKRLKGEESGYALVLALISMLVLMILGTALLDLSIAETTFVNRNEDKLQAYYIARSGAQAVAEYMVADNNDDAADLIGTTSDQNNQIGGGTFTVDIQQDPTYSNIVNVVSTGVYNGIEQTVKVNLFRTFGLFDHAIVSQGYIDVSNEGGSGIDINGSVVTIDGEIDLPDGSYDTDGSIEGASIVLPSVELPSDFADTFGDINRNNNDLELPGSSDSPQVVTAEAEEYFYHADSVKIKNGYIKAVNDGSKKIIVHLFIEDDSTSTDPILLIDTNGYLDSDDNALFYVYIKSERPVLNKGSGASNNVYIYAPTSDITWNNANGASFNGGLVGKNIMVHNHTDITHNADFEEYFQLDTSDVGIIFTGYNWVD